MQGYIQEYSIKLMMAIDPKDYIQCIYIYNEMPPPPLALKSNVQFTCKLMYVNFLFIHYSWIKDDDAVNTCIALCSINLFRY